MSTYKEYEAAELEAGREPLPMPKWRAENMRKAREAKAEEAPAVATFNEEPQPEVLAEEAPQIETRHADANPLEPAVPVGPTEDDMPEQLIFSCENRFRVEVMQAGRRVLVGSEAVVLPHRTIEFTEHHWTADMRNKDHREKAEWLMTESEAFRKGEIILVQKVTPRGLQVQVATGPRTARSPRVEGIPPRPSGELSARIT